MNLNTWAFKRVDNSALVLFRIIFGLLITAEAWGAIATGWVRRTLVEPQFTFNFIGFDFLQSFPGTGPQMYVWFGIMGCFGVLVMLGYKYRIGIIGYAIMWSMVYLMQKTSYNNHYYLLMLLLWIMAFLPANKALSLDAKFNPNLRENSMPAWVAIFIIAQLWIVYTYAAVAKLYPDWLDGTVPKILMSARKDYWLIGDWLQLPWTHSAITYVGIIFDGLIIPALLWKKTRKWAFGISIFFHLFNSVVFLIGIFPYMSLAFTLFFFPTKTIHNLFVRHRKEYYQGDEVRLPNTKNIGLTIAISFLIIQFALPLRHHFITDNVLWTEEGHRLSWRMMLRTKSGSIGFSVVDKATKKRTVVRLKDYLTRKQMRTIQTKPDVIWQFAQRLKKEYAAQGVEIEVYASCNIKVNGRKFKRLIDPKADLAAVSWNYFRHSEWLLDSEEYLEN